MSIFGDKKKLAGNIHVYRLWSWVNFFFCFLVGWKQIQRSLTILHDTFVWSSLRYVGFLGYSPVHVTRESLVRFSNLVDGELATPVQSASVAGGPSFTSRCQVLVWIMGTIKNWLCQFTSLKQLILISGVDVVIDVIFDMTGLEVLNKIIIIVLKPFRQVLTNV